jgi:ATP-dependent Clp protease ATP-binding subunit ClpA
MNIIPLLTPKTFVDSLENPQEVTRESLSAFITSIAPNLSTETDLTLVAERLSAILPEDVFLQDQAQTLAQAREQFEEAKHFLMLIKEPTGSFSGTFRKALDSIIALLSNLIDLFDISCFFKNSENEFGRDFKSGHIFNLISLFSLISDFSIPLIGADAALSVISGITLSLAALSIIFPYIKPSPTTLPRAENWTMAIEQGKLSPLTGRKEILDEMASVLKPQNARPHALLLGESGVGKTETAKAFTQAILRGDYPDLQGKQVFYIKTSDLIKPELFSSSNNTLSKIKDSMGRHRNDIILVFDEVHVACQPRDQIDLCNELKILLNPDGENFPCIIGITTKQEYTEHIQPNAAFDRRFHPIHIENTSEEETLSVLCNTMIKSKEGVLLENSETLRALLAKTVRSIGENAVMPLTASTILESCISETSQVPKTELKQQLEATQRALTALYFENYNQEPESTLDLENRLQDLRVAVQAEEQELAALFADKKKLSQLKAAKYRTIHKVNTVSQKHFKELIIYRHLMKALERQIREKSQRLHLEAGITERVIDNVILKEIESRRKKRE